MVIAMHLATTRRKPEQFFSIIHFLIIEIGIIGLSLLGLWHLFHSH